MTKITVAEMHSSFTIRPENVIELLKLIKQFFRKFYFYLS